MGNMKDFVLAGHSFGGYVAGLYASKYHKFVKKLLLLSPVGIHEKEPDFDIYDKLKYRFTIEKRRLPPRWGVRCC